MKHQLPLTVLLGLFACGIGRAFPPAPYYTIFGTVRDQVGQTLNVEGAVVVLLKGTVEIGRSPIRSGLLLDQNYDLSVRLDHNRSGTALYTDKAVVTEGQFSLAVEMNGSRFLPIEVSGNLRAGKGGERVRLDLNLGEDVDRDGLPDVWEQWQLYQAGVLPDENGNWPINLLSMRGDFDKDGLSDWTEYLAGTFAGDATERFSLEIREKTAGSVRLEFYGITGKTYTIERSTDVKTWAAVEFSIGSPSAGAGAYTAREVGILRAFTTPAPGNEKEFYRLTVR